MPRIKVVDGKNGGPKHVTPDHPDMATAFLLLMEATGTKSSDFMAVLIDQLANAGTVGKEISEAGLNFMLEVVPIYLPLGGRLAAAGSQTN